MSLKTAKYWSAIIFYVGMLFMLIPRVVFAEEVVDHTNGVDGYTDTQILGIIFGALTTYVAARINRSTWASDKRFATFFVLGLVVTFINTWVTSSVTWGNLMHTVIYVVGGGVVWYTLNKGAIKAFEARTS